MFELHDDGIKAPQSFLSSLKAYVKRSDYLLPPPEVGPAN